MPQWLLLRSLLPVLLLHLVGCSDERGGWQGANWGMTPDQVISAKKGEATLVTPEEKLQVDGNTWFVDPEVKVWQRSYSLNGKQWVVFFHFDEAGLNKVSLNPYTKIEPTFAEQILDELRRKWGEPSSKDEQGCIPPRGTKDAKSDQHEFHWTTPKTNVRLYWYAFCGTFNDTFLNLSYIRGAST